MYKLIYKPTRIKPPCATLLDNILTNIQITIDSSKSGIIISDIRDHFFVFGIFDDMRFNSTHHAFKKRCHTEKNIGKFTNILNNKNWGNLYINNNAQNSFTAFYDFFPGKLWKYFPREIYRDKKNRHSWMPNSLLKSIKTNHVLYKLSITKPTNINQATYKNYNNKLNSIKRKAERDHYSNQLEINKSDMKSLGRS